MLRLKTPEYLRIVQSQSFEASYGGAEANVAAGLAMLKDAVVEGRISAETLLLMILHGSYDKATVTEITMEAGKISKMLW